jgi:gamma-glutamyltranspeptidase/glutathione hydrolase
MGDPMDIDKIESNFRPSLDGKASQAFNGMVATAASEATEAGVEMLKRGGNAVDAAVAAALALAVCENQASGLGGQTMMLIYTKEKVIAVDGSSRAPSLAHVNAIYLEDRSKGYRATTVPSTPAVLWYVHKNYGILPWEEVLEPAIRLAQEGYRISHLQNKLQKREQKNFHEIESKSGAKYFLNDGQPYEPGTLFKQPEIADLLKRIREKGIEEFYQGTIAKVIDSDMRENGGLLRYEDLALIPWPIIRRSLKRNFRDTTVFTMPLPAAGRTLLYALLMLNQLPSDVFHEADKNNKKMHVLAEVFRKAFLERSDRPFDPNFYPQLVTKDMLRRKYARKSIREILKNVDKGIFTSISTKDELSGETTHLSVMDKTGMAVSLTQSIERVYGSKAAAAGLGFLYNNYLMDYEYSAVNHPFYLRPNKPPWATVAPTLLFLGDNLWMSLGSPGSERIISTLAQFLIHVLDGNQSIDVAMKEPRMHCSLRGLISLEADRFLPETIEYLKKKGYRIDKRESFAFYLGCIQAVLKCQTRKGFQGIADVRRDGTAKGC